MIVLGAIEGLARLDRGDDRRAERVGRIELRDIGLRHPRLFVVHGEDRRAVLRALVRALPVELGRIMRDREIDLQDAAVGDLARIEGDLDRFRVAGLAARWSSRNAPSPSRRRHSRKRRSSRRRHAERRPGRPRNSRPRPPRPPTSAAGRLVDRRRRDDPRLFRRRSRRREAGGREPSPTRSRAGKAKPVLKDEIMGLNSIPARWPIVKLGGRIGRDYGLATTAGIRAAPIRIITVARACSPRAYSSARVGLLQGVDRLCLLSRR